MNELVPFLPETPVLYGPDGRPTRPSMFQALRFHGPAVVLTDDGGRELPYPEQPGRKIVGDTITVKLPRDGAFFR